MKTISNPKTITLLFALIFGTTVFFANTGTTPASTATEKTIHDYFRFPRVLMPMQNVAGAKEQKVEVVFTTDVFGRVNFVLAKTEDQLLKAEIEKQFVALQLPKIKHDVAHSVVLNFRTL